MASRYGVKTEAWNMGVENLKDQTGDCKNRGWDMGVENLKDQEGGDVKTEAGIWE